MLGPNTVDALARVVDHLNRSGLETTVVPVEGGADVDVDVDVDVELLWACGLLTAELVRDGAALDVVAAPIFAGETAAVYHSVIVVRAGEPLGGRRLAINERGSWSGYRALFNDAAVRDIDRWHPEGMDEIVETGAHVASIAAVVDGRADVAAIDSSIWHWLVANEPATVEGLEVIDRTVDCPAPPFSVHRSVSATHRSRLMDLLSAFPGPPVLVSASIDDYRFMPHQPTRSTEPARRPEG